jgi:hypothetical protein
MDVNEIDLDGAIAEFVQSRTIPIFGIADARGFADALPGWHPKELMPKCESVIVFRKPSAGYDRERCARFIFAMSERSGTQAKICAQCYSLCPWSMGTLGERRQQND